MSDILQKTFKALIGVEAGVGWSAPTPSSPHSLSPSLATSLRQLATVPRSEEKFMAARQIEQCVSILSNPSTTPATTTECIVRGIFIHLLGQDASALSVEAVKLAQSPNLLHRKLGYLACAVLLPPESELRLLLTNCILRELSTTHVPSIITGLIAAANLVSDVTVLPVISLKVVRLLSFKNHLVRVKALVTLDRCCQISPCLWTEAEGSVLARLSDQNPDVVASAVQLLAKYASCSSGGEDLVLDPVLHVQRQIHEGRLPQHFVYRGVMAPWLQVDILRVISRFGSYISSSLKYTDTISKLVEKLLESDFSKETIVQMVISEAIETSTKVAALKSLIPLALKHISKFLQSKHNWVKHTGLDLLQKILMSNSRALTSHQEEIVLYCLEHPDTTIQLKTLSLLITICHRDNVKNIVNSVLVYLKKNKSVLQTDFAAQHQILNLERAIEDLSDDLDWKTNSLLRLLQCSGEETRRRIVEHLKFLLSPYRVPATEHAQELLVPATEHAQELLVPTTEHAQELVPTTEHAHELVPTTHAKELSRVRSKICKLLDNLIESGVRNPVIVELLVWTTAEFSTPSNYSEATSKILESASLLSNPTNNNNKNNKFNNTNNSNNIVNQIINALLVIKVKSGNISKAGHDFIQRSSTVPETHELSARMLKLAGDLEILGHEGEVTGSGEMDASLSFLDQLVYKNICQGAEPYLAPALRHTIGSTAVVEECRALDVTPYNRMRKDTAHSVGSSCSSMGGHDAKRIWTQDGRVDDSVIVEKVNHETSETVFGNIKAKKSNKDELFDGW